MIQIPEWVGQLSQGIILLVVSIGTRALFGIRDELRKLNGRMGVLETKVDAHEELDDERFTQLRQDLRSVKEDMRPGAGRPRR